MEKACSNSKMEMYIKDFIKTAFLMDMVNTLGKMDPSFKEILFKASDKGKVYGRAKKEIFMKVNSKMIRKTALGHLIGKMVIDIKEIC
jgi:hypothetical protein